MKYLIVLALVAQALAGPARKPEGPGSKFGPGGPLGPKPSGPPPSGVPPFNHIDVTGQPPHDISSRPHHPEGLQGHERHRRQVAEVRGLPPRSNGIPPSANGPRPSGSPPPSAKPAPQGTLGKLEKIPQPRFKRHLKGGEHHPTGAPLSGHTHQSDASRPPKPTHPANGTQKKPEKHGHKG